MIVEIGSFLHHRLEEIISTLPIAYQHEGRDTLLVGIPQHGWIRVKDNKSVDISKIIEQLLPIYVGMVEEEKNWGLIIFIDNALREAVGTTTHVKLQDIREECLLCWQKAHGLHAQPLNQKNQVSSTIPSLEQFPGEVLQSSQENSFTKQTDSSAFSPFFQHIAYLLQTAQGHIEAAEKQFCPPARVADSTKRRVALKQLDDALPILTQLCDCLENTFPLPESIAENRYDLEDRIHYLKEQMKSLCSWIDESSGAYQNICEQFERIKQIFGELSVLKEDIHPSSKAH